MNIYVMFKVWNSMNDSPKIWFHVNDGQIEMNAKLMGK